MRVISGKYKRHNLKGYNIDGIRPTKDIVKESVFSIINDYIKDSTCLDLFSGTGSLGIEALSNNARYVYFIDNNKNAIDIIKKNIEIIKEDNYKIIHSDYIESLKQLSSDNIKFDVIFVDPPYGKIKIMDVIKNIIKYDILNINGIIICEYEKEELSSYSYLNIIKEKKYGKTYIKIYKRGD